MRRVMIILGSREAEKYTIIYNRKSMTSCKRNSVKYLTEYDQSYAVTIRMLCSLFCGDL